MAHTEHCHSFVLRLPQSIWNRVADCSLQDGSSINHFIGIAIVERLIRLEMNEAEARRVTTPAATGQRSPTPDLRTDSYKRN